MENGKENPKGHWKIDTLRLPDKRSIRYGLYCADETKVEHFVLFLNGHGEFIEKYDYLPEDLKMPSNYAFLTWDHQGQGASDGEPRLHIHDYDDLAQDASFLVKKLVNEKPYTLMAHSMGGLISLYAIMKGYLNPVRAIMSAPLFGVQHFIPQSVGQMMGKIACRLGLGKWYFQKKLQTPAFKNNLFTNSEERFHNRFKSSYKIEGITFGWIKATGEAIAYIMNEENIARLKTPIRILYGDDERLVSKTAIKLWVEKAKKKALSDVECVELSGTRHEIFAEAPVPYKKVLELTRNFLFRG